MRVFWKTFTSLVVVLLVSQIAAFAQKAPPRTAQQPSVPEAAPPPQRIVIVEPIRVFDPFFYYPYPYAYPPDYMATNFGYVKIKTDLKNAVVYVDGGFADRIEKAKKFALRPGTHDIELRDSDGRILFQERVAGSVGRNNPLPPGSRTTT